MTELPEPVAYWSLGRCAETGQQAPFEGSAAEAAASLRGRVMGLRMLAVYGMPLGLLGAGPLTDRLGFTTMVTIYGIAGFVVTGLILWRWGTSLWPKDAPANAR